MTAGTLADAVLDRRVALTGARDAYDKAISRAAADRLLAEQRARLRWTAACTRAREAAVGRRRLRAHYRTVRADTLADSLRRLEYMLTPVYAQHLDRAQEPLIRMHAGMLRAELTRRGNDDEY